jgi:hypothetical protein
MASKEPLTELLMRSFAPRATGVGVSNHSARRASFSVAVHKYIALHNRVDREPG